MPTLVILRHAEAVSSRGDDHARPLTPRGRADAASSGRLIRSNLSQSLLVLASDARRTQETAELAFPSVETPTPSGVRLLSHLYSAPLATLLKTVKESPDANDTVVLVGHNPGLSELAKQLFATGSAEDKARVMTGMPTAGVAIYGFDEPWSTVEPHTGRLIATLAPEGKTWGA